MPAPYNLTLAGNSTGIIQLVQNVNEHLVDGWFGIMILFATFFIILLSFMASTNNAKQSFAATSFICFSLSLLLRALDLVPNLAVYLLLFMAAGAIAMLKMK